MKVTHQFAIIIFQLPDGRLVLQRRTKDAPYAPDKLGTFGGWVDEGETPDQCIRREVEEETSLSASNLHIKFVEDFILPKDADFPEDRHFFLYTAGIDSLDVAVYEGQGAEAFSLQELRHRKDLAGSAKYIIKELASQKVPSSIYLQSASDTQERSMA